MCTPGDGHERRRWRSTRIDHVGNDAVLVHRAVDRAQTGADAQRDDAKPSCSGLQVVEQLQSSLGTLRSREDRINAAGARDLRRHETREDRRWLVVGAACTQRGAEQRNEREGLHDFSWMVDRCVDPFAAQAGPAGALRTGAIRC